MGRRRPREPERRRGAPEDVVRAADRESDPVVTGVLALQRSAGNAAVAQRLAPSRPVLAREPDEAGGGGAAVMSPQADVDEPAPLSPEQAFAAAVQARVAATGKAAEPVAAPVAEPDAAAQPAGL